MKWKKSCLNSLSKKSISRLGRKIRPTWPKRYQHLTSLAKQDLVKIPVWRHAIINYPHPLLKSGLVVIDTPGLNTFGAEPELTLNIIPNAHKVLFLTATDSGITQSDIQIWNGFIKCRAKYKVVLLNKVDMLWEELKSKQQVANEIDRQINMTAISWSLHQKACLQFPHKKL